MILVKAPLRVSFFGGGTDLPDYYNTFGPGQVLSAAMSLSVYVTVQRRWDERICAHYTRREVVDHVCEIEHDLIREALREYGPSSGVEVTTLADVPSEGTGLGSSSSLTVALLAALATYQGRRVLTPEIAETAARIEIERLGSPIGKQDHYAAAFGGVNHIEFTPEAIALQAVAVPPETLRALESRLMLFFTGRTRRAGAILGTQRANIPEKATVLEQMANQATIGRRFLEEGRLDDFGRLLHLAWAAKRTLASGITDPWIDQLYEAAICAGARGGKLCGAGGGGFLILYVPPERQAGVRQALSGLRQTPIRLGAPGAQVVYSDAREQAQYDSTL